MGAGSYGFTGKEEDVEVGLVYFGKRFLSPQLGRWVSADPLAVHAPGQADLNLYAYVSGAVLKNVDPIGLADGEGGTSSRDSAAATPENGTQGAPSTAVNAPAGQGSMCSTEPQPTQSFQTTSTERSEGVASSGGGTAASPSTARAGGGAPTVSAVAPVAKSGVAVPLPNGSTAGGATQQPFNKDGVSMMPNVPAGQEPKTMGGLPPSSPETSGKVFSVGIASSANRNSMGNLKQFSSGKPAAPTGIGISTGLYVTSNFDLGFYQRHDVLTAVRDSASLALEVGGALQFSGFTGASKSYFGDVNLSSLGVTTASVSPGSGSASLTLPFKWANISKGGSWGVAQSNTYTSDVGTLLQSAMMMP